MTKIPPANWNTTNLPSLACRSNPFVFRSLRSRPQLPGSSQPAPPAWRQDKPSFASLDIYLQQALPQLFAYLDARPREADGTWRIGLPLDRARDLERKALPDLVSQLRSYAANGERKALYSAVLTLLAFLVREQLRNGELPVYMPLSGGGERTRADRMVDLQ